MEKMLSTEELIIKAKNMGVDFGKGDPYNRLRYYTKIGWLPHMTRQRDSEGNIKGHYPEWVLDQLVTIEKLKEQGESNEEIAKKIEIKSKYTNLLNLIKSKEVRTQLISYSTLLVLVLILANEFGVITLGKQRNDLMEAYSYTRNADGSIETVASGTSVFPKRQSTHFVKASTLPADAKVHITFTQNFTPATAFWVSEVRAGEGFEIRLDTPVYYDTTFNWWITK